MRAEWIVTLGLVFTAATAGFSQDTRTVTEPVFPAVCTRLTSQMAIVSGAPASETAFDTTRIQTALTACTSGQAVELAPSGTNYAYLIAPINIPSGVSLLVDGGVTVFASRNPADYQSGTVSSTVDQCGTDGTNGNGCKNLILFNNGSTNVGSGIYGYGIIDGRGYANTLVNGVDSGTSWWQIADGAVNGLSQNNPILMKLAKSTNFTLYKITLRNSPEFHVGWAGTGFTAWGVKIQAPFTAHNTDGIDPDGANVTITNSSISDGDDNVAVGASSAASNITISNLNTYSGHGISVGSYTQAGLTNMLVSGINMAGTGADTNATGIRLKSAMDRGGLIQNVTYQNMCLKDMHHILQFTPFYNTNAGTLIPQFKNITLQNVHFLAPSAGAYAYLVQIQGHDANYPASVTLNNVVFDSLLAANVTPATEYTNFALAGNVYPAFLQALPGTNVTYTGTATSSPTTGAYSCPLSVFPYVVGELYLSTSAATSLQTVSATAPATVTLNAMVQPAMSTQTFNGTAGNYTGAAALTNPISFLEGATVVGTGTLGANGTIASLTLTGVTAGTHTYTAQYPADTNYSTLNFGSVTVTVLPATAVASTTTLTVPATGVYGANSIFTATVTPTSGTTVPTGQVQFVDGSTILATVTLASGSANTTQVLAGGSHSIVAKYLGDTGDLASTSAASPATISTAVSSTALTLTPASVLFGATGTLTAKVTGVSTGSNPTGTVNFLAGTTIVGTGTLDATGSTTVSYAPTAIGTQSITAAYSGDTNYTLSTSTASTLTVTGAVVNVALTLSTATTYTGASVTLTSTVSSAAGTPVGTVTFSNASGTIGTATLASGVATLTVPETIAGAQQIIATYAANGNFLGSYSAPSTLAILAPIALAANPTALTAAAGASSTTTITAYPSGGFTGLVTFGCTTPVKYVTCTFSPTTQTVTGIASVQTTATITVAATVSALAIPTRTWFALLIPFGVLGLMGRRGRLLKPLLLILLCMAAASISGCGASSSSTAAATSNLPPAGAQTITITATTGTVTTSTQITLNISN